MRLDEFRAAADRWLHDHAGSAPPDYGAIVPPGLVDDAKAWQRRLHAAGFAGIHWPVEHGGRGLTTDHTAAWVEACAVAEVPPLLNMVGHVLAAGSLLLFGTDEQRAEHLPPLATGDRVWCQLFSEPGAGSDLASIATRADRDDDGWLLRGQKVWCSNGRVADWGICLARTHPIDEEHPKHRGISFFLVDMHAPGVEVRPLRQMTGGAEFDEVFLDGVRVGADGLLGAENDGWGVAMATLTNERGHIGSSNQSLQRRLASFPTPRTPVERLRVAELVGRGRALLALGSRQGPVASVSARSSG
jgi:alkylation response protein AidB-like acyl-CoA dehydrogenase